LMWHWILCVSTHSCFCFIWLLYFAR
jgi:hypothetical protein